MSALSSSVLESHLNIQWRLPSVLHGGKGQDVTNGSNFFLCVYVALYSFLLLWKLPRWAPPVDGAVPPFLGSGLGTSQNISYDLSTHMVCFHKPSKSFHSRWWDRLRSLVSRRFNDAGSIYCIICLIVLLIFSFITQDVLYALRTVW